MIASIIGFMVGIARLSRNWLLVKVATVYVETFRNIPLLLQLLFWYKAVLSVLPGPRQGLALPLRRQSQQSRADRPAAARRRHVLSDRLSPCLIGIALTIGIATWAHRRQMATGEQFPTFRVGLALIVGLPLLVFVVTGAPLSFEIPELKGFNFVGGVNVKPEFLSLAPRPQPLHRDLHRRDRARRHSGGQPRPDRGGLVARASRPGRRSALVVIPQAMRVIIPPLTSQYLNLTKNSSLAVAIGYPGPRLRLLAARCSNQTGQAVEVIFITMAGLSRDQPA